MALAEYNDLYWFPDGSLARNTPARVFPEHSNDFAPLYADAEGTQPLPNPLPTDNDGRLRFWVEAGVYWISIDHESIRVPIGTGEVGVTPQQVDAAIATHNADTTDVHGIPDTANLVTRADLPDLSGYATDADVALVQGNLDAHSADTTAVHGITDTAALETQAGAQARADAAQDAAEAAASVDATAKVDAARAELSEEITAGDQATAQSAAGALAAHAAQTLNVHGIPDTAAIPTDAQFQQVQEGLAAHEADTIAVHGIADTAALATDADVAAVSGQLAEHTADTMGVHGIADTSQLLTSADLEQFVTDAELAAHTTATTNVHGIPDTGDLVTSMDLADMASDADVAAVQGNLDAHAADTTGVHGIADTAALLTQEDLAGLASQAALDAHANATTDVHGIPDTSTLLTSADLDQYATDADLAAHVNDTTGVHGIADTSVLETQAGAQAKADAAQATAIDMASGLVTEHAADTTAVHGIEDTAALETQSGAQAKADAAQSAAQNTAAAALDAHATATTAVHGIADTSVLETQAGAQAKADAARDAAIASAADTYLSRATGGTVNGQVTVAGLLQLQRGTATDTALGAQVIGETYDRFRLNTNGSMEWGPGTAGREILLEREAAAVMALRDSLFRVYRAATNYNAFTARVTGDTASRWFMNADGAMYWGPGNASTDVGLWRSSYGHLTHSGTLQSMRANATDSVRDIRVSGDAQPRFYQTANGQMYWGAGGTSTLDTTLYRDQAGSLVTDTNLTVNGRAYLNHLQVAGVGQRLFARRTSNLTRANTEAQTPDPQLQVTLSANAVYQMDALIVWGGSTGGDIMMDFDVPAGATGWWTTIQPSTGTATDPTDVRVLVNSVDQGRTYGWAGTGSSNGAIVRGVVVTGASGGTYAFQWAQAAANATGTTVYANSYISLLRVE